MTNDLLSNQTSQILKKEISSKKAWLLVAAYLLLMIGAWIVANHYVDKVALRELLGSTYPYSHLIFLVIEYVYVILVPIYNTPIHVIAGYLFGGYEGWLLNFIATSAALFTIIVIVKSWGRPIVEKLVPTKILHRYDEWASRIGPLTLFVIYVLPILPDDEFTYMIAASNRVQFWRFILPILFGNITKSAMSFVGDEGMGGVPFALASRVVVFVVGGAIILLQEKLVSKSLVA